MKKLKLEKWLEEKGENWTAAQWTWVAFLFAAILYGLGRFFQWAEWWASK